MPNIQIIGVPEEEDKRKDHEKILEEIIVENFLKIRKAENRISEVGDRMVEINESERKKEKRIKRN